MSYANDARGGRGLALPIYPVCTKVPRVFERGCPGVRLSVIIERVLGIEIPCRHVSVFVVRARRIKSDQTVAELRTQQTLTETTERV